MEFEILRKIGLTEGEIRVYGALVRLGKSSTGPIMDGAGISSSKVYLILEKLVQKGLVSYVSENNVKKFQPANPKTIIDYIEKQEKEIDETKQKAKEFVKELSKAIGSHEQESAQIYKGIAGMRVAFGNIIDELEKGEDFLFFSQSKEELENEKATDFFRNLHAKRLAKGVKAKGIADTDLEEIFKTRGLLKQKNFQVKFYELALPAALTIGKTRVVLTHWSDEPIAFEIISKTIAQKYREYFYELWRKL